VYLPGRSGEIHDITVTLYVLSEVETIERAHLSARKPERASLSFAKTSSGLSFQRFPQAARRS
jgi:hypothetical protein